MAEPVGRVLGTVDATPLQFWVAVTPGGYLQLDDVVMVETQVPGAAPFVSAVIMSRSRFRPGRRITDRPSTISRPIRSRWCAARIR